MENKVSRGGARRSMVLARRTIKDAITLGFLVCRRDHLLTEQEILLGEKPERVNYHCNYCGDQSYRSLKSLEAALEVHKLQSLEAVQQKLKEKIEAKKERKWYRKRQLRFIRAYTRDISLVPTHHQRSACAVMVCEPIKAMTEDAVDRLCAKKILAASDLTTTLYRAARIRVEVFSKTCVSGKRRNGLAAAILYVAIKGIKPYKSVVTQRAIETEFFCSSLYWNIRFIEARLMK